MYLLSLFVNAQICFVLILVNFHIHEQNSIPNSGEELCHFCIDNISGGSPALQLVQVFPCLDLRAHMLATSHQISLIFGVLWAC